VDELGYSLPSSPGPPSLMESMNQRLLDLVCEKFTVDPEEIDEETKFLEDLNADSLDEVEFVKMTPRRSRQSDNSKPT
jgi:hypothetical protein